ncbi:STAS domain-containing protein [Phytomonospora endophytica]|uniref:Anti-sigma factor antagonist n=1 Tax=Phytomonospora endophytica TaxID=714109 RepID=A0A841FG14_9ACTN|nr:STAS domain-containing protein [Phytomonospora endophytica]MBB6033943.1 anti-anti-sigma factor [Phytomonospora endophytica]GIG64536.1 anti-sigma-B factor antagonist [Phytomonospora endophytica]
MADAYPDGLSMEIADRPDCRIFRLSGELDLLVAGAQEAEFATLVLASPRHTAVLDMSDVAFCDSTGLGMLIRAARQLWPRGGSLRIAAPQPQVTRLITTNGLARALPLFDSVELACAAEEHGPFGTPA